MGEGEDEPDMSRMDRLVLWMLDKPWRSAVVLAGLSFLVGGITMHLLLEPVDVAFLLGLSSEPRSSDGDLFDWIDSWGRFGWALQLLQGLAFGLATCLWTLVRAESRIWQRAVTAVLLLAGAPMVVVLAAVPESLLADDPVERLDVAVHYALGGPVWIAGGAVCLAVLARLVPRGLTGRRFRLLVWVATGAAALGPIVPIVVFDRPYEGGGEVHYIGWCMTTTQAVAGVTWSVLWVRRGHAWRGWWGFAVVAGLALGLTGQLAQELYMAAERGSEVHWYLTPGLFWERLALLAVVAPFLELARRADGLTMIPSDHPVRDGLRPDGTRVPVREFRRTRPLPAPPPPGDIPEPRAVVGPWGFSQALEPSHGRALYFVTGLLMSLLIAVAQTWIKPAFGSGRMTRPYRRLLVVLVLATVVWAIVQRRRHGPRYHPVWMVWGLVGGLVAWALLFKSHWF